MWCAPPLCFTSPGRVTMTARTTFSTSNPERGVSQRGGTGPGRAEPGPVWARVCYTRGWDAGRSMRAARRARSVGRSAAVALILSAKCPLFPTLDGTSARAASLGKCRFLKRYEKCPRRRPLGALATPYGAPPRRGGGGGRARTFSFFGGGLGHHASELMRATRSSKLCRWRRPKARSWACQLVAARCAKSGDVSSKSSSMPRKRRA